MIELDRPPVPDALPDEPDLEQAMRDQLLADTVQMITQFQRALQVQPKRAVRWLKLLNNYAAVQRRMVAELALDDDESLLRDGADDYAEPNFGGLEMLGDNMQRARRRPRMIGGHPYARPGEGEAPLDGMMAAARAQRIDSLTRTMMRTQPGGELANPAVYAGADQELQGLLLARPAPAAPDAAEVVPQAPAPHEGWGDVALLNWNDDGGPAPLGLARPAAPLDVPPDF